MIVVWATLYHLLPAGGPPFRVFTPGAVVGVALWVGISRLFALFLAYRDTYETTYGALGGAIVFVLWLWLSNLAILFGAEINDVLADRRAEALAGPVATATAPPIDRDRPRVADGSGDHRLPAERPDRGSQARPGSTKSPR